MTDSTPHQARERDRPRYPDIKAEIGEDPARFLSLGPADVSELDATESVGDTPPLALAITRIRGIDSLDAIDAWVQVEEDIGPRRQIMAALMQRKQALRSQSQPEQGSAEVRADA